MRKHKPRDLEGYQLRCHRRLRQALTLEGLYTHYFDHSCVQLNMTLGQFWPGDDHPYGPPCVSVTNLYGGWCLRFDWVALEKLRGTCGSVYDICDCSLMEGYQEHVKAGHRQTWVEELFGVEVWIHHFLTPLLQRTHLHPFLRQTRRTPTWARFCRPLCWKIFVCRTWVSRRILPGVLSALRLLMKSPFMWVKMNPERFKCYNLRVFRFHAFTRVDTGGVIPNCKEKDTERKTPSCTTVSTIWSWTEFYESSCNTLILQAYPIECDGESRWTPFSPSPFWLS